MSKITIATVKSFARKNADKLHIMNLSKFNGMEDGLRSIENSSFRQVTNLDVTKSNDWGIGAWFVGSSRDYFTAYNQNGFVGYEVSNSCGNFVLAVKA